jgi:hypothetical protein
MKQRKRGFAVNEYLILSAIAKLLLIAFIPPYAMVVFHFAGAGWTAGKIWSTRKLDSELPKAQSDC